MTDEMREHLRQLNLGKKQSHETIEKRRLKLIGKCVGSNNGMWVEDDDLTYGGLHDRMKKLLPKPKLCPLCLLVSPRHLSNKTRIYDTNLANWWWLCIRCHNRYDSWIDTSDYICSFCGSNETYVRKARKGRSKRIEWSHIDGKIACDKCYRKDYDKNKRHRPPCA